MYDHIMASTTANREGALVYPDQLFDPHPAMAFDRPVFFLEEAGQTPAVLYRKTCGKEWLARMNRRGYTVDRISQGLEGPGRALRESLSARGVGVLHAADPVNLAAESRIRTFCRETGLLIDARGRPLGGKWSFDPQNRRRLPKEIPVPRPWREAKPGDPLRFPTTREEAEKARPREFAGGFRSAGLRLAGTAAAGGPNGCPGQRRASENFMICRNKGVNKDLADTPRAESQMV